MTSNSETLSVKAVHNFKGANNDELNFNKGDVITVTQAVEGGWWEGTLNGLTGWFPSNYVKETKETPGAIVVGLSTAAATSQPDLQQDMKMYRAVVFKDIVDTESHHVKELTDFVQDQLNPLKQHASLPEKEWITLVGNIQEVLDCQTQLLATLEALQGRDGKEQKIGGAFMSVAPQLKHVHMTYCSHHPKAVAVMEKNKESLSQFVESRAGSSPAASGWLPLATGLSAPFRRLEKYPALLQELQRHTEESHIDRGDTQRAVFVFKDISVSCQNRRRQKELELEVMTGTIRNWEGDSLQSLGEIVQMGCVAVLGENRKKIDHHLVLFSNTLLVLSVSSRLSAFIYKAKFPLSAVTVNRIDGLEGAPHALEINGGPGQQQHLVVSCSSREEQDKWLHLLGDSTAKPRAPVGTPPGPPLVSGPPVTLPNSHVSQLHITLSPNCSPQQQQQQQPAPPPHQVPLGDRHSCLSGRSMVQPISSRTWSLWSLRPHPPLRSAPPPPTNSKKDEVVLRKSQRKKGSVTEERWYEEDMRVLQVIEAYCNSAKTRYTVNSALLDTPQVIIAEEEKMIVEDVRGSAPCVQEKSLVDTVYALKDQVKDLKEETGSLAKSLEEERRCRKKLEELVKKHILGVPPRELLSGISED